MNFVLSQYGLDWFDNHPGQLPILTQFKVGDQPNYIPNALDTELRGNELFAGTPGAPLVLPSGEIQYVVFMDASVGDFSWGEIGLYHNGSLFALGSASTLILKRRTVGSQAGNKVTINAVMSADSPFVAAEIANSSNELNVQVRSSINALAPAHLAVPNLFIVPHPADSTRTTMAYAAGGTWGVFGYEKSVITTTVVSATSNVLLLTDTFEEPNYIGEFIVSIESGGAGGLVRTVASFNATSRHLTLTSPLAWVPQAGDIVRISRVDDLGSESLYAMLRGLSDTLEASDLNQLEDLAAFFSPLVPRDGSRAMTGNLNLGTHRVTNVADPIGDTDAANKQYVDQTVAAGGIPNGVLRTDGSVPMAGDLDLGDNRIVGADDAISPSGVPPLSQVQALLAAATADRLHANGSVIATNHQNFGGFRLGNLGAAVGPNDAVNVTVLNNAVASAMAGALLRSGSQPMTGNLNAGNNKLINVAGAENATDGANLQDITSRLLAYVPRSGLQPMTGPFNAGLFRVTNVGAPTMSSDAVNLGHLNSALTTLLTTVMRLDGTNTMSEDMDMGGQNIIGLADPVNAADAVNFLTMQNAIAAAFSNATSSALLRDGSNSMTGNLDAGNFRVVNLGAPTVPTDAVPLATLNSEITGLRNMSLLRNGTQSMTANLNAGGFRVTNVAAPEALGDAVNFNTLSDSLANLSAATLLRDGSQAMTGAMNMGSFRIINVLNPVNPQDAATKGYSDNADLLLLDLAGTRSMSGILNMGNNRVSSLATPVVGSDAATKNYVDQAVLGVSPVGVVRDDGTVPMQADLSMSGYRILNLGAPVGGNDAARRSYVDSAIATRLPIDGSVAMSGNLNMADFRVRGTLDPILGTDAATKNYVDTRDNLNVARDGSRPASANLSMANFRLQAVGAPVSGTDAANKDYVDNSLTSFGLNFVRADGTIPMTGVLSMGGNRVAGVGAPTAGTDAATKAYVDNLESRALLLNGTQPMAAVLQMGGFRITNLSAPAAASDAATRGYVDAQVATISPTAYLRRDGTEAMAGHLNLGLFRIVNVADPVANQDVATKLYVDSNSAGMFRRDGSQPMIGDFSAGGFRMTNLAAPTAGTDAANRDYVLSVVSGVSGDVLMRDGSVLMTGNLNVNGNRIISLANPVNTGDASNKVYVDSTVTNAVNNLSALTMLRSGANAATGNQNMGANRIVAMADPVDPTDAATKSYVDGELNTAIDGLLPISGATPMDGNLNMDGNLIVGVADPVNPQDAVTKNYADGEIATRAPAASPTFTGQIAHNGRQTMGLGSVSGGNNIDCSTGNVFELTINSNTNLTFSNPPVAGRVYVMTLMINHISGSITLPGGVTYADGVVDTLTANRFHQMTFTTVDGGSRWRLTSSINHDL